VWTVVKLLIAGAAAWGMVKVGVMFLRGFGRPLPEPPPAGELRKVRLRYRCPTCGMELRVETSPLDEPVPPRHCMDEMDLVARLDDA
jgi:hypothetical protein